MASGPNLETYTDIMTGLPFSDLDHGLNGLLFGDQGELYFCLGSNTNGGVPGKLSSTLKLKENFLSGAINVAYLSHPDFNGNIQWSAPDDGNMIAKGIDIYAAGTRNPYSIVLHTNGKLYATDVSYPFPNFSFLSVQNHEDTDFIFVSSVYKRYESGTLILVRGPELIRLVQSRWVLTEVGQGYDEVRVVNTLTFSHYPSLLYQ